MSETDLARSWWEGAGPGGPTEARGGEPLKPEAKENEGRGPAATLLSARDLSCSDQLKPWSFAEPGVVGLFTDPVRMFRMAWAPKLMRRAKGVVGALRPLGAASSSSMADSSSES